MDEPYVLVFTDGGCSGNPGPGGWAYLIVSESQGVIDEKWGAERLTTNNRMELSAAVAALEAVLANSSLRSSPITLYTDSQYVQKGISTWILGWKRNGWKTSNKDPVKNQDLWQKLDQLGNSLHVEWRWVKGHAGHEYNERVDKLTQEAIASLKL
uniref:Ribonuclease H n=1 Tax=Gracilinema caldarium TaxID=215591 RepID=A0A7C3IJE8_9SPIR